MVTPVLSRGFSLIELIVYIGIAMFLMVAVSILLGTGIGSNRFQFEQVLTTEDARRQLELVSDTLRSARNVSGNDWLVAAGDNDVTVKADRGGDGVTETVRYFLDGNNLMLGVTEPGEEEVVRIVARSIRNQLSGQNLFTYFDAEGNQIDAASATPSTVHRIGIALLVNTNENQVPDAGEIITEVKPRPEDTQVIRLWPVVLDLPADPTAVGPTEGDVTVTTTNPFTSEETVTQITMADLNDSRVGTYTGDYYVNLNYQDQTVGSDLPGWYAWIGPIVVGVDGTTTHQVIDKFLQSSLCLGQGMQGLLTTCSAKVVSDGGFSKQYIPILTYTQVDGQVDYIMNITYSGAAASVDCVEPDISLGTYPYSSDTFVEDSGQACRTHCQTAGVASTCPWYTNTSWGGGSDVTVDCFCDSLVPPIPLPDTVSFGQYTAYHKEKWNECSALGQFGVAGCDPGIDFDPTGQCGYQCQ